MIKVYPFLLSAIIFGATSLSVFSQNEPGHAEIASVCVDTRIHTSDFGGNIGKKIYTITDEQHLTFDKPLERFTEFIGDKIFPKFNLTGDHKNELMVEDAYQQLTIANEDRHHCAQGYFPVYKASMVEKCQEIYPHTIITTEMYIELEKMSDDLGSTKAKLEVDIEVVVYEMGHKKPRTFNRKLRAPDLIDLSKDGIELAEEINKDFEIVLDELFADFEKYVEKKL